VKYVAVKNFETFQHYGEKRTPPWIKLYNSLLDDYAFLQLGDVARSHLMLIWLVASRHKNRIPYDAKYISSAIHAKRVDLASLIASGFLTIVEGDASAALADCSASAIADREGEQEEDGEKKQTPPPRAIATAEQQLEAQTGEHYPAIVHFLDARPREKRDDWAADLLRLIGPVTGNLPEDLARACTDGHLAAVPVTNARTLRIFLATCREDRVRGSVPPRQGRQSKQETGRAALAAWATTAPSPGPSDGK
jgi:hypothetical protein